MKLYYSLSTLVLNVTDITLPTLTATTPPTKMKENLPPVKKAKMVNAEVHVESSSKLATEQGDMAEAKSLPMSAHCCTVCRKEFAKNWILNRHIREVHEKMKEFECEENDCDAIFSQKQALNKHLKTVHQGEKNFQCPFCDKWFTQPGNLKMHTDSVHEKKKPFECEICHKEFSAKRAFQDHLASHSDKKEKICSECKKEFKTQTKLNRHIKTVHNKKPM